MVCGLWSVGACLWRGAEAAPTQVALAGTAFLALMLKTVHSPQPTATVHSPQSTVHSPQPTVHSPQPTAHSPQPTAHSPQSTVHSPQSTDGYPCHWTCAPYIWSVCTSMFANSTCAAALTSSNVVVVFIYTDIPYLCRDDFT